jgi:type VI secretion system secreted protein Hcp
MALNAYLTLIGGSLGAIKGSVVQKGRENSILVVAYAHLVETPTGQPTGGLATGKPVHHPILVTKGLDRSTPLLYQALLKGESFTTWQLKFWAAASGGSLGSGQEIQNFTVSLTHARIVSIRLVKPNTTDPDTATMPDREEVAFTYQNIQWTWNDGGISAGASWESV